MYLPRAVACTVSSGEMPLSPAAIAAPQNRRAALESAIQTAQAGFDRAVERIESDFGGMSRSGLYSGSVNWSTWPGNLRTAAWPWGAGGGNRCLVRAPLPPGFESLRPVQVNPMNSAADLERAAAAAGCPPGRDLCSCLDDGTVLPSSVPSALVFQCASGDGVPVTAPASEVADAIVETGSGEGLAGLVDYVGTAGAIFAGGLALVIFGPRIDAYLKRKGFI